jgi:hypothetical protein
MHERLVFDGKRRNVRIGDPRSRQHACVAKPLEDGEMLGAWLQNPHGWLLHPGAQVSQRGGHCHRPLQHGPAGHQPEKAKGDNPWNRDGLRPTHTTLPALGPGVMDGV